MSKSDNWQQLSEEDIYVGYRHLARRRYRLPTGVEADFEVIKGGRLVCILPLTSDNQVVLARQFRPGPGHVIDELPGGMVASDEEPYQAAERELQEETGYKGTLTQIAQTSVDAYATHQRIHFVATDCQLVGQISNDEHEITSVRLVELPDFISRLRAGQMTDIATGYLGLDYLGLIPQAQ